MAKIAGNDHQHPKKLHLIQVLRAIAAGLVIFDHALGSGFSPTPVSKETVKLAYFFGTLGVYIFFVISGFIMMHSQYYKFKQQRASWEFIGHRFVRIVPYYWLITLLALPDLYHLHQFPSLNEIIRSLFFIPYVKPDLKEPAMLPVLSQGWTLNYEIIFYLAFAGCLFLARVSALIALTATFLTLVIVGFFIREGDLARHEQTYLEFYTRDISLLFVVGAWIGYYAEKWGLIFRAIRFPFISLLMLLSLAVFVFYFTRDDTSLCWFLFYGTIAAMCVVICMFNASMTLLSQILEKLGEASYSTYLTHLLALILMHKIAMNLSPDINPFLFACLCLIAANILGYVAYRLVEQPLIKGGRKLISPTHKASE